MSAGEPRKRVTILGSTGSIGRSTLEVLRQHPSRFEVAGLAAHSNVDLLAAQIREFQPEFAALTDLEAARALEALDTGATVLAGLEGLDQIAAVPVDTTLCAVVGAAGLHPLLEAIKAGNRVAVANKEPFVMAGRLVMERARAKGVEVLPVDSEHSAIFQCLHGQDRDEVRCIHLTASGGPFYGRRREELSRITPEQATKHPTWDMGAKISVDSATLMNKGLEIIEAMWLFGVSADQVEVVIHPQSVIHSLVEFRDGHILAHLGLTDMKFPIQFALTYPKRVESPFERLDLSSLGALSFAAPDFSEFPCLRYAREAASEGGTAPAVLSAANEEAVQAFCAGRLPYLQISEVVRIAREECVAIQDYSLEAVLDADRMARGKARQVIETLET